MAINIAPSSKRPHQVMENIMAVDEKHLAVKGTCLATQGGWPPPCSRHWHARGASSQQRPR